MRIFPAEADLGEGQWWNARSGEELERAFGRVDGVGEVVPDGERGF